MSRNRALTFILVALSLAAGPVLAHPALVWEDLYDGGASYLDVATAVIAAPNGDVIVGGESADGVGGTDQFVRRLERTSGFPLWEVRFPAFDGNDMALTALAWDPGGDILVGGYIRGCVG
jgi:hypothetical protein